MSKTCDGKFSFRKCTSCRLNKSIKNKFISNIFGAIGEFIDFLNYNKLNRLLGSRKFSYEFYNSINLIRDHFDFIRYGADWVKKVLLINNFDQEKLSFIRPCISQELWDLYSEAKPSILKDKSYCKSQNVNFLFWGRLLESKGINVIRKAIKLLKKYQYTIHIVGDMSYGDESFKKLYSENKNNRKIIFHGLLDQTSIFKLGRKCDLACFLSWFEAGPITVYEVLL